MSGLKDQLRGVESESLADLGNEDGTQDEVVEDEVVETEELESTEDEVTEDEDGKSKGRTAENVYGELSRKQDKDREDQQKFQQSMIN